VNVTSAGELRSLERVRCSGDQGLLQYLFVGCFILLWLPAPVWAAGRLEVEKALSRIETNESKIQTLRWASEFHTGLVADVRKPETAVFGPVMAKSHVVLDLESNQYRIELDSVIRWVQGVDDYFAERQSWSSNGLDRRHLVFSKPGKTLPGPEDDPGRGRIVPRKEGQKSPWLNSAGMAGINDMTPNFNGERLSSLIRSGLRSKRPVTITDEFGRWTISTPELHGDSTIVIDYDHEKGVVLQAEWRNGTPERPWQRYSVAIQSIGPDLWAPRSVCYVNLFDKLITQIVYSDMKINERVDEAAFRLAFPLGSTVSDFIRKSTYTVGVGTENMPESFRRFLAENPSNHDGTSP
jgi:hypothetical protein